MDKLKVGDVLIAEHYCGFPDHTTQGREYVVTRVNESWDGRVMFHIIADDAQERFPISTSFRRKVVEV